MSVHSIDRQATATPVWRTSWGLICAAVIAGLLSLWPFWDGLSDLWGWWVTTPEYSHGLLVPPIAAFLVWQRKDRLERIDFTGSWWGLVLVLAGGIALLMGEYGTLYALVQYAYLLTLTGLILSFLGWPAFRVIAVPLLILLFMIPLPQFVSNNLSIRLELLSSQIGVAFIRLLDISVFLEGNVIDLGGYKLQVADACSGLRYLFPLMTLGFLVAYFYKGAFWKKVVLFLSSIPITVMMNSLRIGIIGVTVDRWGIAMAEGFLHEFQGWALFMVSAALMVGEMALLSKIGTEHGTWRQLFGVEFPRAAPIGAPTRMRKAPASFLAAVSLLVGFVICTLVIPRPAEIFPNRTSFVAFPTQVGGWHGKRETLDAVFTDQLKMDDYLFADYVNDGSSINLYISYYNSQRKGEAVHSPRSCLPGGGWQIKQFDQRPLAGVEIDGQPLRVNRALVELGSQRQLVYYWFLQRGRIITSEFVVKWYLFWDAVTRHRTDGAMVRLVTSVPLGSNEAAADRELTEFATRIAPQLPAYVPN